MAEDRESGREAVSRLCGHFAGDLSFYKSPEFDETSCRQRFIDPFFAALGWDVADEAKRGPYADVVLEYSLHSAVPRHGGENADDGSEPVGKGLGVRRPDYSFRIGGDRQFFVEAKRPSVAISSPRPAFQVKSYGWSAGVPIVVLTDFEELLVFDCRYRPEIEQPLGGLIPDFRLGFREYVENWDLLFDTFSRQAVADGSLTQFANETKDTKGQLPVDQAFLADLARWRVTLAKEFARRNEDLELERRWQSLNRRSKRTTSSSCSTGSTNGRRAPVGP